MRWPLLLVVILVPSFISFGEWQWDKGERKAQAQSLRDSRGAGVAIEMPVAPFETASDLAQQLHFYPVSLRGRFVPERQFLLDNRVHRERAGFHVLTPFRLDGSDRVVLVNRGWVPAGAQRADLPQIATPTDVLVLHGLAVLPPSRFFTLSAEGNTPPWQGPTPPVWQRLDLPAFAQMSGLPTQGVIVQLDGEAPAGFVRDWPRPDERIARHYSYALQWYGFALATVGIWLFFVFRRPQK